MWSCTRKNASGSAVVFLHLLVAFACYLSLPQVNAELIVGDHMLGSISRRYRNMRSGNTDDDSSVAEVTKSIPPNTTRTSPAPARQIKPTPTPKNGRRLSALYVGKAVVQAAALQEANFAIVAPEENPSNGEDNAASKALLSCYNGEEQQPSVSSSLRVERVFWSERPQTLPLAVFTHLSFNKADKLEALCRSYAGGVISAAVWVALQQPATHTDGAITSSLHDLFQRMESAASGVCSLRLILVSESVSDPKLAMQPPTDALRNLALLAADTKLVAVVDTEELAIAVSASQQASAAAGHELKDSERAADLVRRLKAAPRFTLATPAVSPAVQRCRTALPWWKEAAAAGSTGGDRRLLRVARKA